MDAVYIYCTDVYGNPGPYYTTRKQLEADLQEIAGKPVELAIGQFEALYDNDGEKVAELATPDVVECYYGIDDPMGLMA